MYSMCSFLMHTICKINFLYEPFSSSSGQMLSYVQFCVLWMCGWKFTRHSFLYPLGHFSSCGKSPFERRILHHIHWFQKRNKQGFRIHMEGTNKRRINIINTDLTRILLKLSIYLSIYQPNYLFIHLFTHLPIHPSTHSPTIYLSMF